MRIDSVPEYGYSSLIMNETQTLTAPLDPSELLRDELLARFEETGDRVARAAAERLDRAFFDYVYSLPVQHIDRDGWWKSREILNRAHATAIRALVRNRSLRVDQLEYRR
jgi:hypothetical protein